MSIVFLNGDFVKAEEARISPMDRGFLFGDGIYEVIPTHHGKTVGLGLHLQRMKNGLKAIGMDFDTDALLPMVQRLLTENEGADLNVYIQVSRGTYDKRFHGFPEDVKPTVFAYTWPIAPAHRADKTTANCLKVVTADDLRWQRCHIKSTSLLGNVLHFQHSYEQGYNETLLFNERDELTEGASSNVFVIKDGVIKTPPLDEQILPGVTRHILLSILREHSDLKIEECIVSKAEVLNADEVWMTSASKEVAPVVEIDGKPVADGQIGDIWQEAQALYSRYCFDFD